jgi:N-acetylmuramoyl-L-alanine amidase
MSKYNYILDPGHGGVNPLTGVYVTPGKRSPIWLGGAVYYEGVGNRTIAKLVGSKLKQLGIDYCYTVTPDDWVDWPLKMRVKRADQAHAQKASVLISIHSNGVSDSRANGYEVYTSIGNTASDKYASIWFEEFAKEFPMLKGRSSMVDGDVDKEAKFTIITDTRCPAILIESMFHSNYTECMMLMDPMIRERIADTIVRTIQQIESL